MKEDLIGIEKNNEETDFTMTIRQGETELVRIEADGTVIISKEGADKEAAKIFYESLQFEGQTLHNRIKSLEAENQALKAENEKLREVERNSEKQIEEIVFDQLSKFHQEDMPTIAINEFMSIIRQNTVLPPAILPKFNELTCPSTATEITEKWKHFRDKPHFMARVKTMVCLIKQALKGVEE